MAADLPNGVEAECRRIVDALVEGGFSALGERGWAGRCEPGDLRRVLGEYGRTLRPLPRDAFDYAEIYEVEGQRRWMVDLPLWTEEEGRSDLTLQLSVTERDPVGISVEIDDLRVL